MPLIEHLEKLRHFHKITQHKSINETSQKTGFSQAGLSKSLMLLEQQLGCKLFKRSREGLSLTKEGVEVRAFAQKIIDSSAALEQKIKSLSLTKSPTALKIGMYDSIAIYFGVELSRYLRQVYPSVGLELTSDSSAGLFRGIKEGSLDLAIGVNFHKVLEKKMKYFGLFQDTYALYITSKSSSAEIESSVVVHASATDESGVLTTELFKSDLKGKKIHKVNNFETLKQLVVAGLGVGILPTLVANPLVQAGQIVSLDSQQSKKFRGNHSIGVLVRSDIYNSYEKFIQDILRLGDQWIG